VLHASVHDDSSLSSLFEEKRLLRGRYVVAMSARESDSPRSEARCGAFFHDRLKAWSCQTREWRISSRKCPIPQKPNKAPEPTPTAVTPRAMEVNFEMNRWIYNRDEAPVVPAAVVAHL
jgi:hypothetical protein